MAYSVYTNIIYSISKRSCTKKFSDTLSPSGLKHNKSSKVAVQGLNFVAHPLYIHNPS
jgi:hypothetical protein